MEKYGPYLDDPQSATRPAAAPDSMTAEPVPNSAAAAPIVTEPPTELPSDDRITIYVWQNKYVPPLAVPPSAAEVWRSTSTTRRLAAAEILMFGERMDRVKIKLGRHFVADREFKKNVLACAYADGAALVGSQPDPALVSALLEYGDDPQKLTFFLAGQCMDRACHHVYAGAQAAAQCQAGVEP